MAEKMVKLKRLGKLPRSILGIGNFNPGDVREVPEHIARDFENDPEWEVTYPKKVEKPRVVSTRKRITKKKEEPKKETPPAPVTPKVKIESKEKEGKGKEKKEEVNR